VTSGAYESYIPAARPGGRPATRPRYRILVHRRYLERWRVLPARVGLENARQFYDHIANTLGLPPAVGRSSYLRGRAAEPTAPGFSRTIHDEITGAGRIDYQFHDAYTGGARGDPHPVVRIVRIGLGSH
jgi:hypothetical protein